MNDDPSSRPKDRPDARAPWTYYLLSLGALVLALLLTAIPLYASSTLDLAHLIQLGLLQPLIAALLAFAIVAAMRLVKGRYVGERRKGVTSASSATIAVRLWALCFVLLAGAMFLFALLAQAPIFVGQRSGKITTIDAQVDVKGASPAAAKIKVTQ